MIIQRNLGLFFLFEETDVIKMGEKNPRSVNLKLKKTCKFIHPRLYLKYHHYGPKRSLSTIHLFNFSNLSSYCYSNVYLYNLKL